MFQLPNSGSRGQWQCPAINTKREKAKIHAPIPIQKYHTDTRHSLTTKKSAAQSKQQVCAIQP